MDNANIKEQIKVILLTTNEIIISQIEEVTSEIGEPDCKIIEPFTINEDETLSPWMIKYTTQNTFMISSDKILTIAEPNPKLLNLYSSLIK
jgi:hypothetical protein